MKDLNDLLRGLHASGHVDSEGSFTLDSAVALRKLQEKLSSDPRRAILKAVQLAVAANCTGFRIETTRQGLELFYPGGIPLPQVPQDPHSVLIPNAQNSRLQNHLAVLLLGFIALSTGCIEVPFRTPEGDFRFLIEQGHFKLVPATEFGPLRIPLARSVGKEMVKLLGELHFSQLDLGMPLQFPRVAAMAQVEVDASWGVLPSIEIPSRVMAIRLTKDVLPASYRPCQALVGFHPDGLDGHLRLVQDGVCGGDRDGPVGRRAGRLPGCG